MRFFGWFVFSAILCFSLPLHGSKEITLDEASNKDAGSGPGAAQLARNPHGEHDLWPDGVVPYDFDARYSADMRQQVYAAMADIERQTCVRWVERRGYEPTYVQFMVGDGCYSVVGRSPWPGPQHLSLNPQQGCLHGSVVVHELMHAMGFGHEQNRWDRDEYVIVHEDRIDPSMINNFKKSPRPTTTGWEKFSYEIGSVMHYAGNFFSTGRGDTMEPRVSGSKMGNTVGMTEMDVKQINFLYNCETSGPDKETRVGEKRGDVMPSANEVRRNVTLHVSVLGAAAGSAAASDGVPPALPSPPALFGYILLVAVVWWAATHQPIS